MTDDQKKILSALKQIDMMQILNLIPEHIWWKDKDGHFLGCNLSQARDLGFNSPEELIGKTAYDIEPQELAEKLTKNDLMVMKNGVPATIEEDDYISTKMPLYDEDNKVIGLLGVSINFKEYKDRVNRTHHILDEIIAAMPGHVYWKDRNCILQGCNEQQAVDMGLRSRHEIVGKSDYDILNKNLPEHIRREHATATNKADKAIMDSDIARAFEESVMLSDGKEVTYLSQKTPLHDNKGVVVGLLGISVDITELKDAKERAEAANKAKTEFVQNMQHDIRTPCAGLWGVLNILAKAEDDTNKKEALDMAAVASKKLLELCNDAVEFGDLSGNTRPVRQELLDVRALAQSVIDLNKPAAFARDLLLHFKIDASVPTHVVSDEFRLSRILVNLIGNAIKFTHTGEVTLSLKAEVDKETRLGLLIIEVKDTGIGIAADKIKTIYDKFSRAVASNTNRYPGTGLGLYLVKTFVDELNGHIELESHENQGTYFKLSIPVTVLQEDIKNPGIAIDEHFSASINLKNVEKQSIETKNKQESMAEKPFTHALLIIEDDKTCLFAEKNLLSTFTNDIDTAENVAEALEKLATKRYDLVISDLGLPDGSGNDIVAKVKATPQSPNYKTLFVAMTAHQDTLKHQQAMDAGFTSTHTKPLGAEKATELLKSYPALEAVNTSKKEKGLRVIDLALGMQRIAVTNEELAIEGLYILAETLPKDIALLQQAQKNNDIEMAHACLLKICGGLYYSGTPRLEVACEELRAEILHSLDLKTIKPLFSTFYDEVNLFAEQFKELIKGMNAQKEAERLRIENEQHKALLAQEERFRAIVNKVAHDICSPLASLSMIVESCNHIPEADRIDLREVAMSIGDIANHLLHEYRNKDSDKAVEHEERQAMLVSTVLLESLTHKKYQYKGLPIQFDCSFKPNTQFAFIKVQASSFKRMLSNLINNAVDAFEEQPGTVCLQLEADKEWVKISVQDTGKGMPLDLVDKIMHKTAVTEGKKSGHGLGLTQVWETLDHNHGELAIDSKQGQGTTITVTFPRTTAPHWIVEEIVLNPNDTMVILDDDSSIHGAWEARFETFLNDNSGLHTKHFQLGNEALAFVESLTADQKKQIFLLSDYELLKQTFNGLEIINKSGIQRSILVTSHYANLEVQKEASKTGTKILPKQLASEVVIKMSDADEVTAEKVYAVIVDDHKGFLEALSLCFDNDQITAEYHNPEHLLKDLHKYAKDTKIYLDNNYANSKLTGLEVAKKLHALGYTRLFILSGEASLEAPSYVTLIGKNEVERLKHL